MTIQTPYGMFCRHIVKLDERAQLVTVEGFQRQHGTYPIKAMKVDGGVEELRESHQAYLALRLPIGTRIKIRFACRMAEENELGTVTGHDETAGHTITTDAGKTFPAYRDWDFEAV